MTRLRKTMLGWGGKPLSFQQQVEDDNFIRWSHCWISPTLGRWSLVKAICREAALLSPQSASLKHGQKKPAAICQCLLCFM